MICAHTPLTALLASFGSLPQISQICGGHEKMAWAWVRPAGIRKAGDLPQVTHIRTLLTEARRRDFSLSEKDLIWGVDGDRLEQLNSERLAWEALQAAAPVAAE